MSHVLPATAVFAFVEDGSLRLFPSADAATSAFPGLDAESQVALFFDRHGTYLEPVFASPNRLRKLFGAIPAVSAVSGHYDLVPNASAQEDPFALALFETDHLEANPWFPSLEALKTFLASEGIAVEWPQPSIGSET